MLPLKNKTKSILMSLYPMVLLLYTGLCWGQPTTHIKSFQIGIGVEKPMSFFYDFSNDHDFKTGLYKEEEMVPLGLSFHVAKNISRHLHLHLNILGRPLGNTAYTYTEVKSIDELNYTFTDSNFVRSNLFQIQLGSKYFLQNAPLGTYIHANLNAAIINNSIYRKSTFGNEFKQYIESFTPSKHQSTFYAIDFGMGITKMISERLLIDYGFSISPFWFTFSKYTYDSNWYYKAVNSQGFIPGVSVNNVEHLNKKLLSSEFLKFYVKIGFQNFRYE